MNPKTGQKRYTEEDVADEYDHKRFTGGGKVLDRKEKDILISLVDPKDKKILDIATGTGRFAELLEKNGGEVVGMDASREMLKQSRTEKVQGDALKLPFKDKAFDETVSLRFLHLLESDDITRFIEEVARVTKDKFVFESLHPVSLRIFYQWALAQGSSMFSNSLLKKEFKKISEIKDVRYKQVFAVPYGMYQILPYKLAKNVKKLDEKIIEEHGWTASTVYWELFF